MQDEGFLNYRPGAITLTKDADMKPNEARCGLHAYAFISAMIDEINELKKHNAELHAAYVRAKTEGY